MMGAPVQNRIACLLLAGLLGAAAAAGPARAEGAVAVGLPADVAHFGFASGVAVNRASYDAARGAAMQSCRAAAGGTNQAHGLCTVVATGHNQCIAIAIDPMDGTPGMGWSIAENAMAAQGQALALCRATAGAARAPSCVVSQTQCDGEAN
jgi:hypothetical protein